MKIFGKGTVKQILSLVGTHLLANITIGVVGLVFMASVLTNPIGKIVWGIVAAVAYVVAVYSASWQIALNDMKPHTEETPHILKGVLLPIGILILSIILFLGYLLAWNGLSIDGELATVTAYIYNISYIMSTFAFNAMLGITKGDANLLGHIIMYILPFVASTLGYIAGMKGLVISEKLLPMIYEKKK